MLSIEAIKKEEMKEGKSVYLKGKREGKEFELLGDEETVEKGFILSKGNRKGLVHSAKKPLVLYSLFHTSF